MDRKKSTTEKILAVAGIHFADVGFEGARMDRIAAQAGVNKASIYYNIGNKEALYALVLNKAFKEGFGSLNTVTASGLSPEKKLAGYVRHIASALERNPIVPKIMMREQLSQGRHMPESFVENIVKLLDRLTAILKQGNQEGVFDAVDTVTLHFMIMGTLLFQMTSSPIRRERKAFPPEYQPDPGILPPSVIDQVTRYALRAVKREK